VHGTKEPNKYIFTFESVKMKKYLPYDIHIPASNFQNCFLSVQAITILAPPDHEAFKTGYYLNVESTDNIQEKEYILVDPITGGVCL
jgi:hypothetical protein